MAGGWVWAGLAALLCAQPAVAKARSGRTDRHQRIRTERGILAKVAHSAMPAVVSLSTLQESPVSAPPGSEEAEPQKGLGAGFIISSDGHILTSAHVIEGATSIKASLLDANGQFEEFPARVVGQDADTDFALLKIDVPRKLPTLPLGSAVDLDIADWVVVIGNPFGLAHSVTVGVVSYKGRTDVAPSGRSGYFDYLQTDASINPGNSGGPVLNAQGQVVAIANAVNVAGQGIGFAIPIDTAKAVLPHLRRHGQVKRGWLGISVQDLTAEQATSYKVSRAAGVLISDVVAGGPASLAGLRVGDLITGINRAPVKKAQSLRWEVATCGVGRQVSLKVRRDGKPFLISVRLEEPPARGEPEAEDDRAAGAR